MQEDTQPTSPEKTASTRRGFLKLLIAVTAFLISVILGVPFIRGLVPSRLRTAKQVWYKVAEVDSLPKGRPARLNFVARIDDAYRHETSVRSVWAIKHSSSAVTVYSPICTHLGCYYKWNGASGHFECPCHGSVFALDGKVLGGPAPRPLDALPARIDNGALFVVWEQFKVGIEQKILI